jgi:hypothetical protein
MAGQWRWGALVRRGYPEASRASLQAAAHVDPSYDLNFPHRPNVHGGEVLEKIGGR